MKIILLLLTVSIIFLLCSYEVINEGYTDDYKHTYRYRYRWKFGRHRTFAIKDYIDYTGDVVVHIFNYLTEKAYQFVNGKYTYTLGLYDVN